MSEKMEELGALWLREAASGKKYMSGKIGDEMIVVFKNEYKQEGERTPDYRIYKQTPRDGAPLRKKSLDDELNDEIPF